MSEDPAQIEDRQYDPSIEPESSMAWLNLIEDAEKQFRDYQDKADRIDKLYADLQRQSNKGRDREFALFWANIEVLKPSIYARPPVPVVVPKFKDRRPLLRVSSELLERSTITAFDIADIDSVMMMLRDDVAVVGRGAPWVRYETRGESETESERIVVEYLDRRDFLHDPARNWKEVGWAARRAWMTIDEMKDRFSGSSGDAYKRAAYVVQKSDRAKGAVDPREKCGVWEVWSKTEDRVVWVTEGVDVLLDEGKPHLDLEGFFPCPRPAYSTLQRRSLIPVPDVLYYDDQLQEIDKLTNRIHALADAIQVKGFYPAGGEIGDAVETALSISDDRKVMIPVSSMAAFGQAGDPIVWLPVDVIAQTIAGLIEMRRAIIDDVYQIMGLSDIMRGSTEKNETATAQNLKAQYGSVRIRDKQAELVRVARDLVRIAAEIMAENFDSQTLLDMSQMEIPTDAEIQRQCDEIYEQQKQIEEAAKKVQQQAQMPQEGGQEQGADPEQMQQALQEAQQQIEQMAQQIAKLKEQPTIEKIMDFLRDQRIRPFALDIETDSTIQPDEDAEKQRRMEFMQALGGTIQQFAPVLQMSPAMAPMFGEMVKFAMAPFRAGREVEGAIDDAIEQMVQQASQPQPNPEAEAQQAEMAMEQQRMQMEMQKAQAEQQAKQQEMQMKAQIEQGKAQADMEAKQMDAQGRQQESQARLQQIAAQMERDERKGQLEERKLAMEIEKMQVDAAIKVDLSRQQADQSDRSFEQKSALAAQQAQQKSMTDGNASRNR